jgi:hypothetical protein
MINDEQITNLYQDELGLFFHKPDWWVHTPLPDLAELFEETLRAFHGDQNHDGQSHFKRFIHRAGYGPNTPNVSCSHEPIISVQACEDIQRQALAYSIGRYSVQPLPNVQGSFYHCHHVGPHEIVFQQNNSAAPASFQKRGDSDSVLPLMQASTCRNAQATWNANQNTESESDCNDSKKLAVDLNDSNGATALAILAENASRIALLCGGSPTINGEDGK